MSNAVREILEYLVDHPDAKDTLSGIADWWRSPETPLRDRRKIEAALELLVAEGLLQRRWVSPTEKIYGPVPNRRKEIRALLDRLSRKASE